MLVEIGSVFLLTVELWCVFFCSLWKSFWSFLLTGVPLQILSWWTFRIFSIFSARGRGRGSPRRGGVDFYRNCQGGESAGGEGAGKVSVANWGIFLGGGLSAPKSQRFLRFAIAMRRCPSRTPEIVRFPRQETAMLHCDLRVRWKVASDLRLRAAISEPKIPSFCGISGDLAPSTRKLPAIAIVRFWCAKGGGGGLNIFFRGRHVDQVIFGPFYLRFYHRKLGTALALCRPRKPSTGKTRRKIGKHYKSALPCPTLAKLPKNHRKNTKNGNLRVIL